MPSRFQRYFAELSEEGPVAPSFAKHGAKIVEAPGSVPLGEGLAVPAVEVGDIVEFDVSSLDLTSPGAPANTELAITLNGEEVGTAPVSDGVAHVRFTVLESLQGQSASLQLVADPSTVVQRDFAVLAEEPGDNDANPGGGAGAGSGAEAAAEAPRMRAPGESRSERGRCDPGRGRRSFGVRRRRRPICRGRRGRAIGHGLRRIAVSARGGRRRVVRRADAARSADPSSYRELSEPGTHLGT